MVRLPDAQNGISSTQRTLAHSGIIVPTVDDVERAGSRQMDSIPSRRS
jgi:hypothetical protein